MLFAKRIAVLYLAWFIVLLPVTFYVRLDRWSLAGWWGIVKSLLFGSTFPASWFFSALLICVALVYVGRKVLADGWLVLVSTPLFILTCFCTSYPSVFEQCLWLEKMKQILVQCFGFPGTNFCAGLLWVAIGAYLANAGRKCLQTYMSWLWLALIVGCVLLFAEWFIVMRAGNGGNNSGLFTLPIVVVPIFLLVRESDLKCNCTNEMRRFSIIAYPLHYSIILCTAGVLRLIGIADRIGFIRFAVGLIGCLIAYRLICVLENRGVKIVSYLH